MFIFYFNVYLVIKIELIIMNSSRACICAAIFDLIEISFMEKI